MENEDYLIKIRELFLSVVNKMNTLEKIPRHYGTDELLYASELTAIETLGYRPGMNVTEFADAHGITKGAVSQLMNKLEKKGLATRCKSPASQKEVLLKLTNKGEMVFHQHKLFELQFAEEFFKEFENMKPEQFDAIINFLEKIDRLFDVGLELKDL